MLQVLLGNACETKWKGRGVPTNMLKEWNVAVAINKTVRHVCGELDESAAFVRKELPEEAASYAIAIAKVFETITSEILAPLYEEHPEIAPEIWRKRQAGSGEGKTEM